MAWDFDFKQAATHYFCLLEAVLEAGNLQDDCKCVVRRAE
jgi:hypothetical protein